MFTVKRNAGSRRVQLDWGVTIVGSTLVAASLPSARPMRHVRALRAAPQWLGRTLHARESDIGMRCLARRGAAANEAGTVSSARGL